MTTPPKLTLDVQPQYLTALRSGLKTHEGRLARSRYLVLQPGDHIKIQTDPDFSTKSAATSADNQTQAQEPQVGNSSIFKVQQVTKYKTFKDMLEAHGIKAFLPGRDEDDIQGAVDIYRSFPGYAEGEKEMGVVAIKVELAG